MRNLDAFVILVPEGNMNTWSELSNELQKTVQAVGKSVITVQAEGNRTVSGIVLDEGTIVTTASVISEGEKIRAWVSPDQQIDASVIGTVLSEPGGADRARPAPGPVSYTHLTLPTICSV